MSKHSKRVVRSKSAWAQHIEAWQSSGQSQRVYCERHELKLSTFTLWRRRFAVATAGTGDVAGVEIVPVRSSGGVLSTPIIVWLGGGRYRVEVGDGFCQDTLSQVVNALGAW